MKPTIPVQDKPYHSINGFGMFALFVALVIFAVWQFIHLIRHPGMGSANAVLVVIVSILCSVAIITILLGLYTNQPNQSIVLQLFGSYYGTDRTTGLRWANPFLSRKRVSERVNNFITEQIKVNDRNGNPIEIAAAISWRVANAAQASFGVEDYGQYVRVQSEGAVRHMASEFAYDHGPDDPQNTVTLRGGGSTIAKVLLTELSERLSAAGVEVLETKLTHLAYAPEIASAMLRRQQADAVLSARRIIVEGAVGMVEMALKRLAETQMVELDNERKAAMVSNLLVVLCSERDVTPVVNSGSLYQ